MLDGRFGDVSGRPYIEAIVVLPRFNLQSRLSFLIDTGADCTTISPSDLVSMGVKSSELVGRTECVGVRGPSECFEEPGILLFRDEKHLFTYELNLMVFAPSTKLEGIPSLLGRDIIHQWEVNYDFPCKRIQIAVRSSTHKIRV